MPLIYAFVARDTTVLAEYTPYTGRPVVQAQSRAMLTSIGTLTRLGVQLGASEG